LARRGCFSDSCRPPEIFSRRPARLSGKPAQLSVNLSITPIEAVKPEYTDFAI
jgi:hypothetical protein